jgi:beta-glucosidase
LSGFADSNNNWALPKAVQRGRLAVSFGILGSFRRNIENLAGTQDFYGMNYYSRIAVRGDGSYGGRRELQHVDEMNWENFPQGLYSFLKAAHALSPNVPIWITENGVADGLDIDRERYIRQHLQAVAEAQREGVPVERYYYWSWIDNWEWEQGFVHASASSTSTTRRACGRFDPRPIGFQI